MKKKFLNLTNVIALALLVATFTACSSDNEEHEETIISTNLNGTIAKNETMTLDASKTYTLTGTVKIEGTLNIPAGTTINAEEGFDKYLIVMQGGKMNAKGTASKPIIFRAKKDNAGSSYWGGIIINGYAPISGPTTGTIGSTEVNPDIPYGGTDSEDNSGTLTYVKILNTGAAVNSDVEHNGLTLDGVGSGTTINNIYIADGGDDAVEFFGGTVNVTNICSYNCEDDMFDFTQGYNGTVENCLGICTSAVNSDEPDPRGIESDGNLDGKTPTAVGQSIITIKNVTIKMNGQHLMQDAVKVRRGCTMYLSNALIEGDSQVKDLIDMTDGKGDGNAVSTISIKNSLSTNIIGKALNGTCNNFDLNTTNTGADESLFSWAKIGE